MTTPEEARAALASVSERQHAAIDAAYSTPPWYFVLLGFTMVLLSGVYLASDWVETHLSFGLSIVVILVGGGFCVGAMGALAAYGINRRRAIPPGGDVQNPRAMRMTMLWSLIAVIAVWGIVFAIVGELMPSTAIMLAIAGVAIGAGGYPMQALNRRRAHRKVAS